MTEVGKEQLHASMFHIICMIFEKAVLHVEPWDDSCTTGENMHESHHREKNSLSTRHGIQHTDACKELSQLATTSCEMGSQNVRPKQPSQTDSYM